MKHKQLLCLLAILSIGINTKAQNTSPYWSLAGNSNTTTTSKLGTTNGVSLRFYANNVQRMLIGYSTGNVSIGTTSLGARLTVNTPVGTIPFLAQVNGSTKLLVHSSGGVAIGGNFTPPSNGLYVSGNVGIGTIAPEGKMHIVGSTTASSGLVVSGYNNGIITSSNSRGGMGITAYGDQGHGLYANSNFLGVYSNGNTYGIYGNSGSGTGTYGYANTGVGVEGYCVSGYGGYFKSENGAGISATSINGAYAGIFYGNVYLSNGYTTSDKNLKKNIEEFSGAMNIINKLKPQNYEFKTDAKYASLHLPKGQHYGLMAQDLEMVLPNLVSEARHELRTSNGAEANKPTSAGKPAIETAEAKEDITIKAVNYTELIPVMIKGMQELDAKSQEVETLKTEIDYLTERLSKLETLLTQKNGTTILTSASLEQNIPNPVRGNTTIRYSVPESTSSVVLTLTNATGQIVKSITLGSRRTGQINLTTSMLAAGTYNYTLIADGKQVDSKRLVIAK